MRPPARLTQFAPIFPVTDLRRALAHYESLGFDNPRLRGSRRLRNLIRFDGGAIHAWLPSRRSG